CSASSGRARWPWKELHGGRGGLCDTPRIARRGREILRTCGAPHHGRAGVSPLDRRRAGGRVRYDGLPPARSVFPEAPMSATPRRPGLLAVAPARRGPRAPSPAREAVLRDALAGLASSPKRLSCKYLYDERGSALFEALGEVPEYSLTRAELALLARHGP